MTTEFYGRQLTQMKLLKKGHDGGPDSGVTGYWLIEWKRGFSVVLLNFAPGSREAYHSHAFNAVTWWLKGKAREEFYINEKVKTWSWRKSALKPKFTPRQNFHRVIAGPKGAWALSIRGPWKDTWQESKQGEVYSLTHGRVKV